MGSETRSPRLKDLQTFPVLAQFLFNTSETELDYYHQKVNVRVTSRPDERLKIDDFRKIENFKNNPWNARVYIEYPSCNPKGNDVPQNQKKSAVKNSIEKPISLNFVKLSFVQACGTWIVIELWSNPRSKTQNQSQSWDLGPHMRNINCGTKSSRLDTVICMRYPGTQNTEIGFPNWWPKTRSTYQWWELRTRALIRTWTWNLKHESLAEEPQTKDLGIQKDLLSDVRTQDLNFKI